MTETMLTNDQKKAEQMISEWFLNSSEQFFVLSGYAGTGKTFLLRRIVNDVLSLKAGESAVFVTPTGKAASVLIKGGTPAGTVHSLIYMRDEDDFDVDENGEIVQNERLSFVKREKIAEKIRLIVVDEASMAGEDVVRDILSFGVKCLFCGDNAQLPPVNGDTRLLERPHCMLTEIVRQEENNPIIRLSRLAREGENIPYGNYGNGVCVIPKRVFFGRERERILLSADQIVCGKNKTRKELNDEVRRFRGIENEALPRDGEKLICTLNDWDRPLDSEKKFHLLNGVIGTCKNVKLGEDYLASMEFTADFVNESSVVPFDAMIFTHDRYAHFYGERAVFLSDGRLVHENNRELLRGAKAEREETICRFEFAYAVTCHKAQGSEFDSVVVFDESRAFGEDRNRWLYTAITRAKKKLLIVR